MVYVEESVHKTMFHAVSCFNTLQSEGSMYDITPNHHLHAFSQLRNGNVHYISDAGVGGKVERTVGDAVLSDGQWHTLRLVKNGSATVLRVDGSHSRLIQHATQDFGGLGVLTFSLGGIPPGPAQQKTAAGEGCCCAFGMGESITESWLVTQRTAV